MSNTSVEAAIGGAVGGFACVLTTNALTWVSHRLQLTQGKAIKQMKAVSSPSYIDYLLKNCF